MKKKNVVLALSGLLAVTAAAATTGTMAWFTTSRTATVTMSNIAAYSTTGKLNIGYIAKETAGAAKVNSAETNGSGVAVTATASNALDISGDGLNFFRKTEGDANWTKFKLVSATNVYAATLAASSLYYTEFGLTLSRDSGTDPFKVYLGTGTAIAADGTKDADTAVAQGTRVAIINSSGTVVEGFQSGAASGEAYRYVKAASDTQITPADILTSTSISADWGKATGAAASDTYKRDTWTYTTASAVADVKSNVIADLTTETTTNITVRIWVDGTCASVTKDAVGGKSKISLNFYGIGA